MVSKAIMGCCESELTQRTVQVLTGGPEVEKFLHWSTLQ